MSNLEYLDLMGHMCTVVSLNSDIVHIELYMCLA
jgi:hypothetical protein